MIPTKHEKLRTLTQAGVIAALYAGLTLLVAPLSFGPVQFRLAEILTILPVFTVAAVPGLTLGCLIANALGLAVGANLVGAWDLLIGTGATLLASFFAYALRNARIRRIPIWSALSAVVFNTVLVGAELYFALFDGKPSAFWLCAGQIGLGELVTAGAGGLFLAVALTRTGADKRIFGEHGTP